jgi:hypothetical protein
MNLDSYTALNSPGARFILDTGTGALPISKTNKTRPFGGCSIIIRLIDVPWRGTEILEGSVTCESSSGRGVRIILYFVWKMSITLTSFK